MFQSCFVGDYSQRQVNKFIRWYYCKFVLILHEANLIPKFYKMLPDLVLTQAQRYYGKICFNYGYPVIKISLRNICNPYWDYDCFIEELTDTIIHELAHLYHMEHDERHEELMNLISDFVLPIIFEQFENGIAVPA